MKKIVTTIALIMAFSLTAYASHVKVKLRAAERDAPAASTTTDSGVPARTGHTD